MIHEVDFLWSDRVSLFAGNCSFSPSRATKTHCEVIGGVLEKEYNRLFDNNLG